MTQHSEKMNTPKQIWHWGEGGWAIKKLTLYTFHNTLHSKLFRLLHFNNFSFSTYITQIYLLWGILSITSIQMFTCAVNNL